MAEFIPIRLCSNREAPVSDWPFRPVNFFLSMFAHAGVVCALAYLPPAAAQAETPIKVAVYKVIELKKEPVIYWAPLPAVLPSVDSRSFKGEERSRNEKIVVQQSDADPARQLVWQPDKPELLKTETPLQNMVAMQDKPKPKAFVPPKERPKPALAPGVVAEAPPELTASVVKMPGSAPDAGALPKRPAPFVPPPAPAKEGDEKTLAAPPEISATGMGSTATAAVIGLNPALRMAELPDGSRPAAFSRADKVGEPSGGAPGEGPNIPGVAVAGNRRADASLVPLPVMAPSGTPPRSFELRVSPGASTVSAPLRPSSRTLPRAIEARFQNRIVYVLVIPKPNLPEYIADWTMWFSERIADSAAASSMRPPAPVRKILRPDSAAGPGAGAEGWVRIAAVIAKDGKIGSILSLPGRTPAVAAKAAEDLANWEFRPAARNGEPIEVEVVIEMPFRLR